MKLVSINVGQPREVETARGPVLTAIYKQPVTGRVHVAGHNIQGDRQADLSVHGGPSKAIYGYALDHYAYWGAVLPEMTLTYGNFGENLTVEGLTEDKVHIGDRWRAGTALLRVTQPRMPCAKLALRFQRSDMVKLFWKSNRSGVYFAIEEEGDMEAGEDMALVEAHPLAVTLAEVLQVYKGESDEPDLFRRVMEAPVAGSWKQHIQEMRAERIN